jgi:uncharacterized zinc-type alcohol dehydrogenase-like protein
MNGTKQIKAFGNHAADKPLEALAIGRRSAMSHDVEIEILYCGVCHSDLHQARNDWRGTTYPCVPGHEIVGKVTSVGTHVTKFKVGDLAAIGCMVDSCRECEQCKNDLEQFCDASPTYTYNSPDKHLGGQTFGGYSENIIVDEHFVLRVPNNLDLAATAPLLCAGITTYSPLKHWKVGPGSRVGVVGIGGLGHMAVKLAKAMGAYVVAFTTSASKTEEAKRLGADEAVVSTDKEAMKKYGKSLHVVLDTVAAVHDVNMYLGLLKLDGALVLVGLPDSALPVQPFNIVSNRRIFTGSSIGGIAETQEMLDFCSKHNIVADIELIDIQHINEAYERMLQGDVRYRFVIDMASLKK